MDYLVGMEFRSGETYSETVDDRSEGAQECEDEVGLDV